MAFLDFLKNRRAEKLAPKPVEEQKPTNREQWHTQEAAEEKVNPKSAGCLPDSVNKEGLEAAHRSAQFMEKATQHQGYGSPADQGDTREALMHNHNTLKKSQEAMSPTDSHRGHRRDRDHGMER